MSIITVDEDQQYAPCCYLICRVHGKPGSYDWDTRDEDNTVLVQTDFDWPGLASTFGWCPCECGETDGTVDCPHKTASEMIDSARQWLDDHLGQIFVEDPGYFTD